MSLSIIGRIDNSLEVVTNTVKAFIRDGKRDSAINYLLDYYRYVHGPDIYRVVSSWPREDWEYILDNIVERGMIINDIPNPEQYLNALVIFTTGKHIQKTKSLFNRG